MRKHFPEPQPGATPIESVQFDLRSRDEIPKLLMGLQYIYLTPELREQVFCLLEEIILADLNNGRPGMELWKILVLGTLRLSCNLDFDKLQELANDHKRLRQTVCVNTFETTLL